jgi:hypothetical protein
MANIKPSTVAIISISHTVRFQHMLYFVPNEFIKPKYFKLYDFRTSKYLSHIYDFTMLICFILYLRISKYFVLYDFRISKYLMLYYFGISKRFILYFRISEVSCVTISDYRNVSHNF